MPEGEGTEKLLERKQRKWKNPFFFFLKNLFCIFGTSALEGERFLFTFAFFFILGGEVRDMARGRRVRVR